MRINQYNKKGNRDGYWEGYYNYFKRGYLMYKGKYNNGNLVGYWEWYRSDGTPEEKNFYAR
jgi:hypothetical protein